MSEKAIETAIDKSVTLIQDGTLEKIMNRIDTAFAQYGPDAVELTYNVLYIDAVIFLVTAFLIYVTLMVLGVSFNIMQCKGRAKADCVSDRKDWSIFIWLVRGAIAAGHIPFIITVANIYNWYAIFDPKIVIAKRILERIL